MGKHPDSGKTVRLVLELLKRIPRHRKVTAQQLHAELPPDLARNIRTVQRQLEMLSEVFDIERDDSQKPYGYRWKENTRGLSVPTLSQQESLLLALAQEHLRNLLPASLMRSMEGFFSQAKRELDPLNSDSREREWLGKVRVVSQTQPLLPATIEAGVFEAVSEALYRNQWLNLTYKNAENVQSNISVMPLGLAQQGPRLYLVCRYDGYNNERSLALHRILKAELRAAEFQRPPDFRLDAYDNDGRFGFGEGRRIHLVFHIQKGAGQHLLETKLASDQEFVDLGEEYKISATVVESAQLIWWLRGFGAAVRVVSPAGLLG
jgi:predicted DNA-binding transcriptional regulator YafY